MEEVTVTFEIVLPLQVAEGFSHMGADALEATKAFPGCREVRIIRHKDDPCRFLFVERWDSEAAYREYIAWRTERGEFQTLLAMASKVETNIWPVVVAAT